MRRSNFFAFIIIVSSVLCSCDANRLFEDNFSFNKELWHKDSLVYFDVDIPSNQQVYNVYINCRVNGQYKHSNLFLFIETSSPDDVVKRDTLECIITDPTGKELGKGFGNIWSYSVPYKMYVRFPEKGKYKFSLQQAMRDDELEHVLDVGIRVEEFRK